MNFLRDDERVMVMNRLESMKGNQQISLFSYPSSLMFTGMLLGEKRRGFRF